LGIPKKLAVQNYLSKVLGQNVHVNSVSLLGIESEGDIKKFGYGVPILVKYSTSDGSQKTSVISTSKISSGFGHDYRSDRAACQFLAHDTWNKLPNHVRVLDIGAFTKEGSLISLSSVEELFLLRELAEGTEYHKLLDNMLAHNSSQGTEITNNIDIARLLSRYLAHIHSKKYDNPELYRRRIRDTVGSGECIFGLADSYPQNTDFVKKGELEEIEKLCVEQRWKLRDKTHRLSAVHGDFHPWNVIVTGPTEFKLLDRSRGEYGEPADDVTSMSINYLFYSLRKYGKLANEFETIFNAFFEEYKKETRDSELSYVMPLFYTFRCLVIGSPIWYPDLPADIREKIFNFARNILQDGNVEINRINEYLES
jgi:hypothetical protein